MYDGMVFVTNQTILILVNGIIYRIYYLLWLLSGLFVGGLMNYSIEKIIALFWKFIGTDK